MPLESEVICARLVKETKTFDAGANGGKESAWCLICKGTEG